MVQVHIEGSADEVRKQMQELLGGFTSTAEVATPAPKKEKKTAEAPAEPKSEVKSEAKAEKVATTPTFQDVKDIIPQVMAKLGKPGIVELLAKFGAKKGSEVKEAQYEEFLAAAKKALA